MKKRSYVKKGTALFMAAAMSITMMSGCSNKADNGTATTQKEESSTSGTETNQANVLKFEDIKFPDEFPLNPTLAEEGYYDYDDMSKHYELEFHTYNYGPAAPEDDPIKKYLEEKYNVTITLTTAASPDMETSISTRFSDGDVPDLITLPTKDYGFTLGEQGLLVDAKEIYPYMPQTSKFVTNLIIDYSTMKDGTIPFFTKYAVQGDLWGLAIRKDWLKNLGMEKPTTKDELIAYAKACTFDDPDGNGKDDTYFMIGAGGGAGVGMLDIYLSMFGNPNPRAENGKLVSPMFDGSKKAYISFLNELYSLGTLASDWYTIDWNTGKSYTMNDKVGMVKYPAQSLYQEYTFAKNGDFSVVDVWEFFKDCPIEGGKYSPGQNPGNLFAIPKSSVEGDPGKLQRIAHIMDELCYGGEDYFEAVQGGGAKVFESIAYKDDVRKYIDGGKSICYVSPTHPGYTIYGTDNLALAPWQNFGYTLIWMDEYSTDEKASGYVDIINKSNELIAQNERWPNDSLLFSIPGDTAPNLKEFEAAKEFQFITGEKKMDEWDNYVKEWMDQGGRATLLATAESLGCDLPEEMK